MAKSDTSPRGGRPIRRAPPGQRSASAPASIALLSYQEVVVTTVKWILKKLAQVIRERRLIPLNLPAGRYSPLYRDMLQIEQTLESTFNSLKAERMSLLIDVEHMRAIEIGYKLDKAFSILREDMHSPLARAILRDLLT